MNYNIQDTDSEMMGLKIHFIISCSQCIQKNKTSIHSNFSKEVKIVFFLKLREAIPTETLWRNHHLDIKLT
jgi:hypothetical protein